MIMAARYALLQHADRSTDIGEIWANILHNVYAALVTAHGFSATAKTDPTCVSSAFRTLLRTDRGTARLPVTPSSSTCSLMLFRSSLAIPLVSHLTLPYSPHYV